MYLLLWQNPLLHVINALKLMFFLTAFLVIGFISS